MGLQFLSPLEMSLPVDKVIPPLLDGAHIEAGVLARLGRVLHPNGPGQDGRLKLVDARAVRSRRVRQGPRIRSRLGRRLFYHHGRGGF